MSIPESIRSTSPFTLQTGREFLAALQSQEQTNNAAEDFKQALEATSSITDTLEIASVSPALNTDPTVSTLFQAHLGPLAVSQAVAALADGTLSVEGASSSKVTGISATTAAGPFANGQSPQPDEFRPELPGVEFAQTTRYPSATGIEGDRGTYGARLNPQVGARLDLKG